MQRKNNWCGRDEIRHFSPCFKVFQSSIITATYEFSSSIAFQDMSLRCNLRGGLKGGLKSDCT